MKNILVFSWKGEYTLTDILNAFNRLHIQYEKVVMSVRGMDKSNCPELFDLIDKSINDDNYDAVFSVNYFPDVAKACDKNNILYISWTYDCPLDVRNIEKTIGLPTNRAFFFDRTQCEQYLNENNTVFHLPLAVDSYRISKLKYNLKYASDVSFVGNGYLSQYRAIAHYLDKYYVGYLDGVIEAQKKLYGSFIARDALSESLIAELNENLKKNNSPYTKDEGHLVLMQFAVAMANEATFQNRLMCLGLISKHLNLKWYTRSDSIDLKDVKKCPPVDYNTEMPTVFYSSKINLHIGLHAIPSGISLRQLDIMSCGGFLLSSFQPELLDYFIPGEDFDYFTSPEEALEKCRFYLSHDKIRSQIAESGCQKTNEIFNYDRKVGEMLEMAFS